jgi:benzodiazapine receptor
MEENKLKWWHVALVVIVANLISAIPAGINGEAVFYNSFQQPAIAPPDWLFAPIWLFLNITSAWALYLVANLAKNTPGRKAFLVSEAIGWVLFAAFALVYFGLKSSILGAVVTVVGLAVAIISFMLGLRLHKRAAVFISLRVLWLLLASYVSVYIATHNADTFFG